jgi:hypothetical protein
MQEETRSSSTKLLILKDPEQEKGEIGTLIWLGLFQVWGEENS